MKLLTIAIPSYNRADKLNHQIATITNLIDESLWQDIEFVILDNCSTDHTEKVCKDWKLVLGDKVNIYRNETNVGLVGNYLKGIQVAHAKYYWAIGDDDVILQDLLENIIKILKTKSNIALLHINHRCIDGVTNGVIYDRLYDIQDDIYGDGIGVIKSIVQSRHSGGLMFITANVLNVENAKKVLQIVPKTDEFSLSYPLLLTMLLANYGNVYVIAAPLIDCLYNVSSWRKHAVRVLEYEVPNVFFKLLDYSYDKEWILKNIPIRKVSFRDIIYLLRTSLVNPDSRLKLISLIKLYFVMFFK